jgi:hypothetical protein
MIEVVVGQPIPLTLQVYDGNSSLKVVANLYNEKGDRLFTQNLSSNTDGLYTDFSHEMPDTNFVVAQYITDKTDEYEIAQDIFKSIPRPIAKESYIIGEVFDKDTWDDSIIGEVQSVEKET